MLAMLNSATLVGVNALPVSVEVDVGHGLPHYSIVGLPDAGASESYDRVWGALRNSGFHAPLGRITVNLAPGDIRKEGPHFDLAIALGLIAISEESPLCPEHLRSVMVLGELSMAGDVRPVRGVLPALITAKKMGLRCAIVPRANASEASFIEGISLVLVEHLSQAVSYLLAPQEYRPPKLAAPAYGSDALNSTYDDVSDMAVVCGQRQARRALEISAAGKHHLLLIGPPGSGKTLLARCLPTILPPLSQEQALEVTAIHSTLQRLAPLQFCQRPPFRAPSTNISLAGLMGSLTPGEISLAHHGVLFMDEFPEYRRDCLESLRAPLERGQVEIARAKFHATYPCGFTLVAAMNPCPCGYFGDAQRACVCTATQRERYYHRISEPLLDRIALQVRVHRPSPEDLIDSDIPESSAQVAARVRRARERQQARQVYNEQMTPEHISRYCHYDSETTRFLQKAIKHLNLSARVFSSLAKVARTIADLKGMDIITLEEVSEALEYRTAERVAYLGEEAALAI